ncbi:MAG: Planktothrix phage PaV-LD, partial [Cyanobacteriota bacterium]
EVLGGVFGGLGEVVNILIGSWQSALITSTVVVGGLAIAFRAQLIPAVLSFISIQLAGVVTSSASAFVFLAGVLTSLGFSSMAITAGTAALHLQMLSASASLGTLTMGGLALAVKSVALSVATLLAPLAAVAAVVGGVGLVLYSQSLKDSTEATQELANRTEEYGDLAIDSLEKLSVAQKKQQESEKSGIRLTDEEYKNNQKLQNQAKLRIGLIEDQITALKEQEKTVKGDANKSNIQSQIGELEKLKTALAQASSNVVIAPKDLMVLGTALEQLKKKANEAMDAILKPSGDQEVFKKKASEVIEFNMALLEMGQTIDKDVITKLRQLANDTRLDQEVQRKAQETITKVIEQESKKRSDTIAKQKAEVESQQKNGEIGVRKSEKLITDLTIKELEERKSAQQQIQSEQRAFGNIEAARKAGEEIKKIESDITKAIAEERSKRNEELVKNFQEQQSIIEGYLAQGLTTEKNYNNQKSQLQIEGLDEQIRQQRNKLGKLAGDDKEGREAINAEIGKLQVQRQKTIKDGYDQELSTLEKQLQKTVDLVKEAELIRQSEVQKSFNEFGGNQNLINEENVKNNLKTLEAEYSNTVKKLKETKSQPALSDPRLETDRQTKIRKLRQEQLQQSLGMLKVEKEAWDAHTQTVLGNIAKENNAQLLNIEKQINSGNVLRELEGAASATDKVQELQVLLSREKDINKQAELRLSLEKAIREEREAWGALGIAEIEAINNLELIALKNLLNQGKILKEEYDLKIAQQAIETLQKRISLETDVGKKIKLQLQLVEEQGRLIDANVRRYEAGLNKEAQAYENTIKRQNNELDNQSRKFDILNKALQMRSELQDAQKGVFDAASSFYSGELDALVQGERSERKKKQLAELISAIKLKSAIQQAEFEKQSLISQQLMKTIELEREKIAARRALNDAKIEKRKADNALKVAKKDPRTTPEQLEELQTAADIAGENVGYQEQNLGLLRKQEFNQSKVFKLQREALEFRSQGAIRSAQVDLANNTSNRSLKRQRFADITASV